MIKISSDSGHRILAFTVLATLFFLAISLYTHCPTDPSWFYFSTFGEPIANAFGIAGSYCSSLLLYVFGSTAYLLLIFGAYIFWIVIKRYSFNSIADRISACLVLIFVTMIQQSRYSFSQTSSALPGGIVGHLMNQYLFASYNVVVVDLFLFMMIWISFVVFSRLFFMSEVGYAIEVSQLVVVRVGNAMHTLYDGLSEKLIKKSDTSSYAIPTPELQPLFAAEEDQVNDSLYKDSFVAQSQVPDFYSESLPEQEEAGQTSLKEADVSFVEESPTYHEPVYNEPAEAQFSSAPVYDQPQVVEPQIQEQPIKPSKPYELPPVDIFVPPVITAHDQQAQEEVQERARVLEEKLECFGVHGSVVSIKHGPVVTLFEYSPDINTKISKIMSLEDDLALALQALSIRIIAPVPGTSFVGFEVANKDRKSVSFSTIARSEAFEEFDGALPLILGQNTIGDTEVVDLASMPHLLIAGSTGSGKSVALNAMLMSLVCKRTPKELRMILIDPKRLEFAPYVDMAHLLVPIITHPKKSIPALKWVVQTMEERYEMMATSGARNISDYNRILKNQGRETLPFIVVVIDELADLMMTAGKEIEGLIVRIAQMARASGIHMIVATQRPSVDVITGLIKVNFPSRISFRVTSKVDSRTILDGMGAEKLLGKGDMLFLNSTSSGLQRVHGAYISDSEISEVVSHIRAQQKPDYLDLTPIIESGKNDMMHDEDDELYASIIQFLETIDEVSISLLQRRFRIGYNRSARLINMLENQGRIMMSEGGKVRKVVRE